MRLQLYAILLPLLLPIATASAVVADDWTLDNFGGFHNVTFDNVTIPTTVWEVLQGQGIVGEPSYRYNERDHSWVAADTWTFTARFKTPENVLRALTSSGKITLVLDKVDTAAIVSFNRRNLGTIANAHRRHVFDVTALLVDPIAQDDERRNSVRNTLRIRIDPAGEYAARRSQLYPYSVPFTHQIGNNGAYNFIRKPASDFGWDWGPAFAPAGLGAVHLLVHKGPLLMDAAIRQTHLPNGSVALGVDTLLRPGGDEQQTGYVGMSVRSPDSNMTWVAKTYVRLSPDELSGDASESCRSNLGNDVSKDTAACVVKRTVHVLLQPSEVTLWWPWDLVPGKSRSWRRQPLYNIDVTWHSSRHPEEHQIISRRVGLRHVQLIQQPIPSCATNTSSSYASHLPRTPIREEGGALGETFEFRINGVPVFARGANVVPFGILQTKNEADSARKLVHAARAANMNFLRVWGGGRYAVDEFYEICDELGIMVWQEFMFACAMYPTDEEFLRDVVEEARQQAQRLSGHASVIVWGGNNENEASLQWFPETRADTEKYKNGYVKLFVETLRPVLLDIDNNTVYVDGSPYNGLVSRNPYVKRWGSVSNPMFGDVHFYDYHDNMMIESKYPPAKFVSEFGFMSLPSFDSYAQETSSEDWSLASPMMKYRMRHDKGLDELKKQLEMHFVGGNVIVAERTHGGGLRQATVELYIQKKKPTSWWRDFATGTVGYLRYQVYRYFFRKNIMGFVTTPRGIQASHDTAEGFRAMLYLTQLQQALIYETAASRWRRGKQDCVASSAGMLYWQLNDVWAGPSWSGINRDGRWKILHHAAKRFFAPIAVFGTIKSRKSFVGGTESRFVEVSIVNDMAIGIKGALRVEAIRYDATVADDGVITIIDQHDIVVAALAVVLPWQLDMSDLHSRHIVDTQHFLRFTLCLDNGADLPTDVVQPGGCIQHSLLLAEPKQFALSASEVFVQDIIWKPATVAGFEIILRSGGGVAVFAVLETTFAGVFSDNAFHLLPWETKVLLFTPEAPPFCVKETCVEEFRRSLRLTWLRGLAPSHTVLKL